MNSDEPSREKFLHTLLLFTHPEQQFASEEDILKKYVETEKKRHIEYLKHTENKTGVKLILKHVVKRVTIEGEHTFLMIMREDKESGKKQVIELQPMLNAPL